MSVGNTPLAPLRIELIGDELALAWSDGKESYLKLEPLRRHCPCAACGGEPDVTGRVVRPTVIYKPESFALRSWNVVGGYALQPVWGDGHASGLFPYSFLRKLSDDLAS